MRAHHGRKQTGLARREHELKNLHPVFEQHGDRVSRFQWPSGQPLGQLQGARGELAGGVSLASLCLRQNHSVALNLCPAEKVVHSHVSKTAATARVGMAAFESNVSNLIAPSQYPTWNLGDSSGYHQ